MENCRQNSVPSPLTSSEITTPTSDRRAVLLVNTKSRRGREWFEQAHARLQSSDLDLIQATAFRRIEDLKRAARQAVAEGVPYVVAGGGDGTFSSIARYFVGTESVLGVLPLGTGNAFARDLGIPAEVAAACDIIAGRRVARVDLGIAADDYFLNVATMGLTTRIAQALTVPLKRKWGRFVYAFALVDALRKVRPFRVKLESEQGIREFETLQVVLGNGRFHAGPFPLSPDASITEGRLTLYALTTTNKAEFLRLAAGLPTGQHVNLPNVLSLETVAGTIQTTPSVPVTVDGEVCLKSPFKYAVAADALRVLVPESFSG